MRRIRQMGLLPRKATKGARVSIVGLGTLGSWVALALGKMGIWSIDLWDGDKVQMVNIPLQVYDKGAAAAGWNKASIMGAILGHYEPDSLYVNPMWDGDPLESRIIVSGVDSFDARRRLFEEAPTDTTTHFIDLRSGRETLLTYCVDLSNQKHRRMYQDSLQVSPLELDCREQGIVYVGMRAGAEASAMVAAILRGMPVPFQQVINTNFFDTEGLWNGREEWQS